MHKFTGVFQTPKYLHILKKARLRSNCKIKMSAIAVRGGRIVGIGYNTEGSAGNGRYQYSRHAESSLLQVLLWRAHNANITSVFVYREHAGSGIPLQAKPCARCTSELLKANIKRVYYSTEAGWEELKLWQVG